MYNNNFNNEQAHKFCPEKKRQTVQKYSETMTAIVLQKKIPFAVEFFYLRFSTFCNRSFLFAYFPPI